MRGAYVRKKRRVTKRTMIAAIVVLITFSFILRGSADSPADLKRVAFDAIDRNADPIALVGDVIYYYGEPGMQEYETAKISQSDVGADRTHRESRRGGVADQCMGEMGIRKTSHSDCDGDGLTSRRFADPGKHSAQAAGRRGSGPHGGSQC